MHSALLIDEVLQLIFEAALNDSKGSLYRAARCCQAWKDPALDRIWRQLPSAIPLLSLLPGFSMENDVVRLEPTMQDVSFATFLSYCARVKHIAHCHRVVGDLQSIPMHLFHQLSNLESVRITSRAIGEIVLRMSLAARLRSLTLQVGYAKSSSTSMTMHSMMSLLQGCSSLEQLSVRGYSSECLHMPLSGITTLRSLSLHLSSLTEQSFMTASTFPHLIDFDVHADLLSPDDLSDAISRTYNIPFFPALEKLKIRAQPALVASIIPHLPRNKLRSFHMDTTGPASPSAFENLFQAVAALPLDDFTVEHASSLDESQDIPPYTSDKFFTLEHFRPLSNLPLRQFVLDSSLPPDLSDAAIEEMTRWWPLLGRLELGAHAALENVETTWKPRLSLVSLTALARGCKHLQHLVISLDAGSVLPDSLSVPLVSHPLTSLSISSRSRPDVSLLPTVLSRLFPTLVDVMPGFVGEHEEAWAAIQTALLDSFRGTL